MNAGCPRALDKFRVLRVVEEQLRHDEIRTSSNLGCEVMHIYGEVPRLGVALGITRQPRHRTATVRDRTARSSPARRRTGSHPRAANGSFAPRRIPAQREETVYADACEVIEDGGNLHSRRSNAREVRHRSMSVSRRRRFTTSKAVLRAPPPAPQVTDTYAGSSAFSPSIVSKS